MHYASTQSQIDLKPSAVIVTTAASDKEALKAIKGSVALQFATTTRDAERALVNSGATALITRPRDANGLRVDSLIRSVLSRAPKMVIGVIAPDGRDTSEELLAIRRAGGSEMLLPVMESLAADTLRFVAHGSWTGRLRYYADVAVKGQPPQVASLVHGAISSAGPHRSVEQLCAVTCAGSVRTAERTLRASTRLTPRQLLAWSRVLAAAIAFDSTLMPTALVANELDFQSSPALCNMVKRYTGMTRLELSRAGGADVAFRQFRALVRPM